MSERHWSEQQESIFDWFKTGAGSLVVRARAGTGKSSAIHLCQVAKEENVECLHCDNEACDWASGVP